MSKVYTEDIKTAIYLTETLPVEVVNNLFRFNSTQAKAVTNRVLSHYSSINAPTNKGTRKAPILVTPRMTEVAATLNYMGYSQSEIAELYNCDNSTISKKLNNYLGYKKSYRYEVI